LKEKGISRAARRPGAKDDFHTIVAKIKRGEKLIADLVACLQGRQSEEKPGQPSNVTEQDNTFGTRSWIVHSVNQAIEEIGKQSAFLGAYLKARFRADNGRFVLEADSKWNVD
jgi:hypothetical protein